MTLGNMGKERRSRGVVIAAVMVLAAFLVAPMVAATPATSTCAILKMTMQGRSQIVIELSDFVPQRMPAELGVILVPPDPSDPGSASMAKHWQFEDGWVFNYSNALRMVLLHDDRSTPMENGDGLAIESLAATELSEGTWQLFLMDEQSGYPSIGITWVLGHSTADTFEIPYSNAGVADPMSEFDFTVKGSASPAMIAIIGSEVLILVLFIYLLSRME